MNYRVEHKKNQHSGQYMVILETEHGDIEVCRCKKEGDAILIGMLLTKHRETVNNGK